MEQLHEARQKQKEEQALGWWWWRGGWSACCSIGRGINNSMGRLGKLPEAQYTQSLDLTRQPRGAWILIWGAIQGLVALGFRVRFEF